MDRGRRRHPRGGGLRRVPAPPHSRNRRLPESGPGRQVHRHRHQGVRKDPAPQGQADSLPARGTGRLPARRQPARQADRRQDLRPGVTRLLRRLSAPVVQDVAHGDLRGHAEVRRCGGRSEGRPPTDEPDCRRRAPRGHRSLRPSPRLHAERAPPLRHRYRRASGTASAGGQVAGRHLHRRCRRVLYQACGGPHGPSEHQRRAVTQRVVLCATRPGGGRVSAAPHQPSSQGLCRRAKGGVRPPSADDGDGPAVSRQCRRHFVLHPEPPGDLRQQRSPREERPDGTARAGAG